MHYPFTKRLHTEKSKKNDESIVDWKNKGPVLKKKIYIYTYFYIYIYAYRRVSRYSTEVIKEFRSWLWSSLLAVQ